MKKAVSLILAFVLCLSLCACDKDMQDRPNNNESTANEGATNENAESTQTQVDNEFLSTVCGSWNFYSGWRELGGVLEFRENGTCTINEEELKWDATFKSKQWLDEPKEFVNIYRNNELVYEAHINMGENGTITLVISENDDAGLGIVPAGTYGKSDEN